ncbi:MAG TPA: B12-binding domain-containing radical SAM protein, partial [Nitrospinaceae bacterium]|nr:B12-binding domain-containing radical SAM protein [Nitrospinaceae bacterium]
NFYCTMAYPGSPLYNQAQEEGWPLPNDPGGPGWIGYSQHGYESLPLPTNSLTSHEVLDFRDYAFEKHFSDPKFLNMTESVFGSKVIEHIQSMLKIKLKRTHRDPLATP